MTAAKVVESAFQRANERLNRSSYEKSLLATCSDGHPGLLPAQTLAHFSTSLTCAICRSMTAAKVVAPAFQRANERLNRSSYGKSLLANCTDGHPGLLPAQTLTHFSTSLACAICRSVTAAKVVAPAFQRAHERLNRSSYEKSPLPTWSPAAGAPQCGDCSRNSCQRTR
jgi:hypothetical protein